MSARSTSSPRCATAAIVLGPSDLPLDDGARPRLTAGLIGPASAKTCAGTGRPLTVSPSGTQPDNVAAETHVRRRQRARRTTLRVVSAGTRPARWRRPDRDPTRWLKLASITAVAPRMATTTTSETSEILGEDALRPPPRHREVAPDDDRWPARREGPRRGRASRRTGRPRPCPRAVRIEEGDAGEHDECADSAWSRRRGSRRPDRRAGRFPRGTAATSRSQWPRPGARSPPTVRPRSSPSRARRPGRNRAPRTRGPDHPRPPTDGGASGRRRPDRRRRR